MTIVSKGLLELYVYSIKWYFYVGQYKLWRSVNAFAC